MHRRTASPRPGNPSLLPAPILPPPAGLACEVLCSHPVRDLSSVRDHRECLPFRASPSAPPCQDAHGVLSRSLRPPNHPASHPPDRLNQHLARCPYPLDQ